MKRLIDLFKVAEWTRSMPQTGYAAGGMPQALLGNLAEHHFLVTFMAWQLSELINQKGGELNTGRVLEYGLVHDLGELLGGDISMHYATVNPKARTLAKAFEQENREFLAKFFPDGGKKFLQLHAEMSARSNDEVVVAKVADYIEVTHYKLYQNMLKESDLTMIETRLKDMISKASDRTVQDVLNDFVQEWVEELPKGDDHTLFADK